MSKELLQDIFQSKYDSSKWRDLLGRVFQNRDFFAVAETLELNETQKKDAKAIKRFGEVQLADSSRILFYEVELKDGKKVTRNRVGLRNIIKSELIPGYIDGVLVTYYSENTRDWRITFISKSLYWDNENKQVKTETHPKRYTYVVGENEACATAIERFDWLLSEIKHPRKIDELLYTFSVEKISSEFFAGYRHQFEKLVAFIEETDNKNLFKVKGRKFETKDEEKEYISKSIRNWVKKFQGRIVFLYFLQKKGWLGVTDSNWGNGQKDFMRVLFNEFKDKKNFYEKCLTELFFNTLNRDRAADDHIFEITGTQVPFLNGGLFEKEAHEPTNLKFKPEDIDELLAFFDQYNFTIDENSPDDQDIGVDPEMLGLIFENLLEENRKKTGAFYTPKEVVHFMCRESLSLYVQHKLKDRLKDRQMKILDDFIKGNVQDTPAFIKDKDIAIAINKALTDVRICDPAIGSGAFPMGLVFEILRLKRELFPFIGKKTFDYQKEKLSIIQNSIYGVDIDKGAVDISRLRFWLALIVDEEVPSPLPNLDYKIMQGNSLLESFEGIALDVVRDSGPKVSVKNPQLDVFSNQVIDGQTTFSIEQKENLHQLVNDFFNPDNHARKSEIQSEIDELIHSHINGCYVAIQSKVEEEKGIVIGKIAAVKSSEAVTTAQKEKNKVALEKLDRALKVIKKKEAENEKIKERLDIVQETDERPYFLWHLMFKEVFDNGGFDIVIGNPPYGVSIDNYKEEPFHLGSGDSYGAFSSYSLSKLLKMGGILSFIVSDTWLTIKTHKPLREQLLQWELRKVIRLHQDCFRATVNSCVFTLVKNRVNGSNSNKILAADLTNISTRKEIPLFRDKLFKLEECVAQNTPQSAVYTYEQSIISNHGNKPIFVASPRIFELLNESVPVTLVKNEHFDTYELPVRQIMFNSKYVEIIRLGDIAEVKQGLATGDNDAYLYQRTGTRGSYRAIESYQDYLLTNDDLSLIRNDEIIRNKVTELGIHQNRQETHFDKDRWFEGRYIVPHDKGGESDVESGWLPNYYVPTNYFIDWSTNAVHRLKSNKGKDGRLKSRFQNTKYYFRSGIDYSQTGIYSPTFRINSAAVFNTEATSIFSSVDTKYLLGILCSKLFKYILKNFIDHTVHASVDKIKECIIPAISNDQIIANFVSEIIVKQKTNPRYEYNAFEQATIDQRVYEICNLSKSDINEIETWFARRYPKLAKYADITPLVEVQEESSVAKRKDNCLRHLETIQNGENRRVEFKSTLRFDLRKGTPEKHIEHSIGKTIAAFLNSDGGELFIGVDDEGNILGLDADFNSFKGSNKKDEFQKHFDNLIQNYFGNQFTRMLNLEFCELEGKVIAVVTVNGKSNEQIYLTENGKELFYVRRFSSTVELTTREAVSYIKEHWG